MNEQPVRDDGREDFEDIDAIVHQSLVVSRIDGWFRFFRGNLRLDLVRWCVQDYHLINEHWRAEFHLLD